MRLVIALAAVAALPMLTLAGPACTANAQSPVSTQPLAAGEVLLEVDAMGSATTRSDLATFHLFLTCHGATEAEARRESEQQIERVRAAARAVGVAAADVEVNRVPVLPNNADPAVMAAIIGATSDSEEQDPAKRHVLRSLVGIRLRNVDRVPDLAQRLRALDIEMTNGPAYSLADNRVARHSARADAIASARASAEGYADSLGMRVARIVRVSERININPLNLMASDANVGWTVQGPGGSSGPDVATQLFIGVDFALAPR